MPDLFNPIYLTRILKEGRWGLRFGFGFGFGGLDIEAGNADTGRLWIDMWDDYIARAGWGAVIVSLYVALLPYARRYSWGRRLYNTLHPPSLTSSYLESHAYVYAQYSQCITHRCKAIVFIAWATLTQPYPYNTLEEGRVNACEYPASLYLSSLGLTPPILNDEYVTHDVRCIVHFILFVACMMPPEPSSA